MTPAARAARARALAVEAGFDLAGVASADAPRELGFFQDWIARGYAGEMAYLTAQRDRRADLRTAFPWARSVVCVGLQYDTPGPYSTASAPDRGWIARYAWGDDYHDVVKARLEDLRARLVDALGPMESRVYVDTGPVLERAYARRPGSAPGGKNTCLLHPEHGSWFFLGEVITDLDAGAGRAADRHCGTCTACLDACPTGALVEPYVLDATRCISYLTIEVKGADPGGSPRRSRRPRLRLRHLPGRVPVEPQAGRGRRARLRRARGAAGPGPRRARRPRRGAPSARCSGGVPSSGPSGGACCATWRRPRQLGDPSRRPVLDGCSRTKIRSSASMRSGVSIVWDAARELERDAVLQRCADRPVRRAGRDLDVLAARGEHRARPPRTPTTAPFFAPLPPPRMPPMIAPPTVLPPMMAASLPWLSGPSTSMAVVSSWCSTPRTTMWSKSTARRDLPFTRPAASARYTGP